MKKIIETNNCIINYSDSLEELAKETIIILDKKINEYKKFFQKDFKETITVNYFDTKEEFRRFIYELRNEDSLPEYATATYDNCMINAYINPSNQLERIYTASHELFHILYLKFTLEGDYSKRIVWYDEGMAQYMSGEKDKYNDIDRFRQFYLYVKSNTKEIPNLTELVHGNDFVNDKYNAYSLSYLSIRYLSEIMKTEEFNLLKNNFDKIKKLGKNITQEMFNYYDNLHN